MIDGFEWCLSHGRQINLCTSAEQLHRMGLQACNLVPLQFVYSDEKVDGDGENDSNWAAEELTYTPRLGPRWICSRVRWSMLGALAQHRRIVWQLDVEP